MRPKAPKVTAVDTSKADAAAAAAEKRAIAAEERTEAALLKQEKTAKNKARQLHTQLLAKKKAQKSAMAGRSATLFNWSRNKPESETNNLLGG